VLGLLPSEARLPDGAIASSVEASVSVRVQRQAQILADQFIASGLVKSVSLSNIHLPWQRLFEIGCQVEVTLA
jgi:hypothetical protein